MTFQSSTSTTVDQLLWDRKREGGFPETKELKNRVRNVIEPDRDLGHVDRSLKKEKDDKQQEGVEVGASSQVPAASPTKDVRDGTPEECRDCP